MQCSPLIAERTKPLLGTFVRIRVQGLAADVAAAILARCFAEVAAIHRLMSFQEETSDVSRLNRNARRRPVRVDARTHDVLRLAAQLSRASGGVFDITAAPSTAAAGRASRPRWSDVELLPDHRVRYRRALRLDLSGIAKGYAVDRVIDILGAASPEQAVVDAGGDLRVLGTAAEWVRLGVDADTEMQVPTVELRNESIASSGRRPAAGNSAQCSVTHVDGASLRLAPPRFVSVLAATCAVADALTKVVMARGDASTRVLRHFGARAVMSEGTAGWRELA